MKGRLGRSLGAAGRLVAVLLACSFGVVNLVAAAEQYYYCELITTAKVADSGSVQQQQMHSVAQALQNRFVIDRQTGAIIGGVFANASAQRIEILDQGSAEQAFKVLSVFGPHVSVDFLQVQTFRPAAEKPFSGMSQGRFYSGLCE